MMQPKLLSVPEVRSPRLRRISDLSGALAMAKSQFNILTHWDRQSESGPWLAVLSDPDDPRDIAQLMSQEGRLLDESGRTAYGSTERDAVIALLTRAHPTSLDLRDLVELGRELGEIRKLKGLR